MRLTRSLTLVVLALGLTVTSAHASAILKVNGSGILTGATGVNVGGTLYDVEFVDGTCEAIFDGCDDVTDFPFTSVDAGSAAQALLDQVFQDGGQGAFDSMPSLTFGCLDDSVGCFAYTPFGFEDLDGVSVVSLVHAHNFLAALLDGIGSSAELPAPDTTQGDGSVYARWTPSSDAPVPEPASLTLLGLGLAGMAGRRWRQRKV